MKNKFKSNKQINNKLDKIFILTIILILIITFSLLKKFTWQMDKNLEIISENELKRVTYNFLSEKVSYNIFNKDTLKDILIITKNSEGKILYVDFNLDIAYKLLADVSDILSEAFKNIAHGSLDAIYYDSALSSKSNNMILSIPFGSILNSTFFYNIGPRIPVSINFIGSILTNLETKITNYGLNNALVEVFINIKFSNQIITPFKEKNFDVNYNTLIASMMIEGAVPNVYDGLIKKSSNIYSASLK